MSTKPTTRRRPVRLLVLGMLLILYALAHAYWPRSNEVLLPVTNVDGKFGYINHRGHLVHGFQWERAGEFGPCSLATVTQGEHSGAIDRSGKVVIPLIWDKMGGFHSAGVSITRNDRQWGLIDRVGNVVVPHQWSYIRPLWTKRGIDWVDEKGWAKVVVDHKNEERMTYGWVDSTGKVMIPAEYEVAEDFDEHGWACVRKGKQWGWIDRQGQWVMPPEWDYCSSFDAQGWAAMMKNKKAGYINRQGKIMLPLEWEFTWPFHASGYAQVTKNEKRGLIDRHGKLVMPQEWQQYHSIRSDLIMVMNSDGKHGCVNQNGQIVVPMNYAGLSEIRDSEYLEAAHVNFSTKGVINSQGKTILEFRWKDIDVLTDGGHRFYRATGDRSYYYPMWLQLWLMKIYAFFGRAWEPGKLCHVYDTNMNLVWRSDDWMHHLSTILGSTGSVLLLLGVWRNRRQLREPRTGIREPRTQ